MEPSDQRNLMLALGLMLVVFVAWQYFIIGPQQQRARQEAQARAAQTQVVNPTPAQVIRTRDQIVADEMAAGTRVVVEGPAIDGSISLLGARIDDVSLKGYYDTVKDKLAGNKQAEVQLLSPQNSGRDFYAVVAWKTDQGFSTADALWTQTTPGSLTNETPLRLAFTGPAARIDRVISIDADYMFTIEDTLTNTGAAPITLTPAVQIHQRQIPELMAQGTGSFQGVVGTYGTQKNQMRGYGDLAKGSGVAEEASAGWIALTTKYWMAAAVPPQGEPVTMKASVTKGNGEAIFDAGFQATAYTIQPGQSVTKTSRIFAGAKRVAVLEKYENSTTAPVPSFTDAVDWSWMFFITKPFFYMLQAFSGWFGSFGWAILALTVVVKTVFFPLQFNMYKSMSKMRLLQPRMKEIQERFAADPQRMRLEQANLFKTEKVNPLAGCLPLLPTIFVFWALYHTLMVTIEMRHTPFLGTWIQDMSAPDPISIFNAFGLIPWNPGSVPLIGGFLMIGPWALLYGVTMLALQGMSAPPTDPIQKAIMRWLPLVFTILFAGFAAGLVIYWVWSNLLTIGQQYIIMRRTGVETEFDKFFKKRFGKKPSAA